MRHYKTFILIMTITTLISKELAIKVRLGGSKPKSVYALGFETIHCGDYGETEEGKSFIQVLWDIRNGKLVNLVVG